VEELKLEAHIAALFTPPTSYNGSERASAIDGRLFLGSACSAQDPLWLQENQITHILNVADEVGLNEAVLQGSGIAYRWLSIADRTFHFALNFDLFPHPERIPFHFDSTSTSPTQLGSLQIASLTFAASSTPPSSSSFRLTNWAVVSSCTAPLACLVRPPSRSYVRTHMLVRL
jgi:hypothetical protein